MNITYSKSPNSEKFLNVYHCGTRMCTTNSVKLYISLRQRAGAGPTDAYFAKVINCIVTEEPADGIMNEFAQISGPDPEKLHAWSESVPEVMLLNAMEHFCLSNGIEGQVLYGYLEDEVSEAYLKTLMLACYQGNRGVIDELLRNFRLREKV